MLRVEEGVAQGDVELFVADAVQEHVHAGQVVGRVIDLLPVETIFDMVFAERLLDLQQQGARSASRVVDLIDRILPQQGQPRDQLRHALRGEELAARFACVGGIVGDEELIGVAKEVDLVVCKVAKVQAFDAFNDGRQSPVLIRHGVAQPIARRVKVGKEPTDVIFGILPLR